MPRIVVLQHHPDTGPSAFVEVLDQARVVAPWQLVDLPAAEEPPAALDEVAGVLVMGGPMSATAPQLQPWMPGELEWLRGVVRAGVPTLGVCLGAQLLGSALGGAVTRRHRPEIGFIPLARTAAGRADPVTAAWEDASVALLIHEDEVSTLPPGARPLLTGGDGTPAWRVGPALAVQFHPEVPAEQLETWTRMESLAGVFAAAGCEPARLAEEARRREAATVASGRALLRRWIQREVGARMAPPVA